ncbi:MAG TPA: hypothetical protein VK928_01500 [Longimicrobiales bacterium]|nr:hypothetical protein [Longimicrobiales bacterium]
MRSLLLAILAFTMFGTGSELVLLEHTESRTQLVPLVLLGIGLVAVAVVAVRPHRATLHAFRAVMAAFILAGAAGLYYHYRGNVEFELEMYPEMRGWKLVWEALSGATPALAPGAMMQMGLLGLACTFRHPLLQRMTPAREEIAA